MYCSKNQLKSDLKNYLSGYMPGDINVPEDAPIQAPNAVQIIAGFKSVKYDTDAYVKDRIYESLGNDVAYDVLTCVCLIHVPPLKDCMTDFYNGYLDFILQPSIGRFDIRRDKARESYILELLRWLYFCDTYESFWLFVNKHGNIEALYKWYQGINPSPEYEKESGIPCYCKANPELTERFEAFFDIQPEKKKMVYSIEGEEVDRYMDFRKTHLHKGTGGKMGDSFKIAFYESGVGCIAQVRCLECGEVEILTNLDNL